MLSSLIMSRLKACHKVLLKKWLRLSIVSSAWLLLVVALKSVRRRMTGLVCYLLIKSRRVVDKWHGSCSFKKRSSTNGMAGMFVSFSIESICQRMACLLYDFFI